ncbi:LacI family transcriptional regulator [Sphingomonas metalli]|uniref:LacI family transcriptional regulator n=1 Tax=Sphingomonas metalli TaxID=1779358 RepID=A0A916WWM8_9SPHN|nr:LacI family DNA-binding transcriptional regulator [Sphingomonas metalli]GGB36249.1 LacI family transcriptional regulator [Sphingomonas metalli]
MRVKNLKEFAALAGVSTATASRALTGTGRVSDETRARIAALAERLGYQPNIIARNLRTQRTNAIGVLVPLGHDALQHLSDPFFSTMTGFLADALADRDYDLMLSRVLPHDDRWLDQYIGRGRVDGIIIIGQSDQRHVIDMVSRRYMPMVVWGAHMPEQHYCAVGSNNVAGGALAAGHLADRGCRRIAFAGPSDSPEFAQRLDGVRQALAGRGLDPPIVLAAHHEPNAAYADLSALFDRLEALPDGIVGGSDVTATAVLRLLAERGHPVPQAVRVVGYDGLPLGEHVTPPLTTVDQQLRHGAELMVTLLLDRIAGVAAPSQRIEPRLIVRASS